MREKNALLAEHAPGLAGSRRVALAAAATTLLAVAALGAHALAQQARPPAATADYPGVWYDDTGQGAVEIGSCGQRLCGRIVWLRDPSDKTGKPLRDIRNPDPRYRGRTICGLDVIGDLKPQPNGTWDNGWIYDPKEGKSYDVELKLRSADALQVTGYLGVKFLSETLIWRRAPADLKRCEVARAG